MTVDKKKFEVKAVKTSQDYKKLRTEVNSQNTFSDSLHLLASSNLTSLTCTQSWILVLHQSAAPHIIIHLVQAFYCYR